MRTINYVKNQSTHNLQRAIVIGIPVAISLIINILTAPPPWGVIIPFAYLFISAPFWIKQFRNIDVEPHTYFLKHPWLVNQPKELLKFQVSKFQIFNVPFRIEGSATAWIGGYQIPRDIIVDGKVYRYTLQPTGARFNFITKKDVFWTVHDSWVYTGKEGLTSPPEPIEVKEFSTGMFGREKWYYIVYNGGVKGGFDLLALCNAVCVFDADGNAIDSKVQEFLRQMKDYGGVWEKVDDKIVALYFSDRDGVLKAKDWIISRWIALQFSESS